MPHNQYRIPRKDADFDQYLGNTAAAIAVVGPPDAWTRLGVSLAEKDQWVAYNDQWLILYPQFTNDDTRTKSIIGQKNALKEDFIAFASPLLLRISGSAALTLNDRNVFHLPERDASPTQRGPIEDTPYGKLEPKGVATVKVRVRLTDDASRSSIHPLADGVEVRYALIDTAGPAVPDPMQPPATSKDATAPPTMAADAPLQMMSPKALFTLPLDPTASGKRLYLFMRWANQSTPANSGPWSTPVQTVVL